MFLKYVLVFYLFFSSVLALEHSIQDPKNFLFALQSHEDNYIGYTFVTNRQHFMDLKISVKYLLFYTDDQNVEGFIAFSGRFAQYVYDVPSEPVIAKRINPEFFLRYNHKKLGVKKFHIDLIYGHESNGMSDRDVNTSNASKTYWESEDVDGKKVIDDEFYQQYLSRGWDYWGVRTNILSCMNDDLLVQFYGRYFMQKGLIFQENAEQFIEGVDNPNHIKNRNAVDGFSFRIEYDKNFKHRYKERQKKYGYKMAYEFVSGWENLFRSFYHTHKFELGFKASMFFGTFPFRIWYKNGYMIDVATYNRRQEAMGFNLELHSF